MKVKRVVGYGGVGALACVGLAVMLPVAGAVGAVTLLGGAASATIGAVLGAGAACATDKTDKIAEAECRGRQRGESDAKAKYAQQLANIEARYKTLSQHLAQQKDLDKLQLAMVSVGIACLHRCGAVNDVNVMQVKDFVFGVGHRALPKALLYEVNCIVAKPPTLKTAFARSRKLEPQMHDLFDQMVNLAAYLNDASDEHGLAGDWTALRAA
jgi:hypothetical protein